MSDERPDKPWDWCLPPNNAYAVLVDGEGCPRVAAIMPTEAACRAWLRWQCSLDEMSEEREIGGTDPTDDMYDVLPIKGIADAVFWNSYDAPPKDGWS